jgi:hypothetical protein
MRSGSSIVPAPLALVTLGRLVAVFGYSGLARPVAPAMLSTFLLPSAQVR